MRQGFPTESSKKLIRKVVHHDMTIERVTAVEVGAEAAAVWRKAEAIEDVPDTNVQAAMDIPTITHIHQGAAIIGEVTASNLIDEGLAHCILHCRVPG